MMDLKGKWLANTTRDGDSHVTPIADAQAHTESRNCWCQPAIEGRLVVHHSFDGREAAEPERDRRYQEKVN